MVTLDSPLNRVLPAATARTFARHRDLHTVRELLWLLPRRLITRHQNLDELEEGAYVVFSGTVIAAASRRMQQRSGTMLNVTVRSGPRELDLTFFKAWGHEKALQVGRHGLFAGRVSQYRGRWQLAHPAYDLWDDDEVPDPQDMGDLIPVYPEVGTLASWTIGTCMAQVLDALGEVPDALPSEVRARRDLPGVVRAFRAVHRPQTYAEHGWGLRRLKFDEAFVLQAVLASRRAAAQSSPTTALPPVRGGLAERMVASLPFALTPGQQEVCREIGADLAGVQPMQRLLQGDVGSGKTIVALWAMLRAVDQGAQAALLAPTEVLAAQHEASVRETLGPLLNDGLLGSPEGVRVVLLTGSMSTPARRAALLQVVSGEANLVIGTHALIQEAVTFAQLGVVVVDEQHRFGVEQRDALRNKADGTPHTLVMTATPIPRTVAMTVFGDLETSVLRDLPPGRSPIATHVIDNPGWYERMLERIVEEVQQGHQAYVVCSRIGEEPGSDDALVVRPVLGGRGPSEGDDAGVKEREAPRSVHDVAAELGERFGPREVRVGILHGALSSADKEAVMAEFVSGRLQVLVATTIVEVGVNVPNATVMAVMDADRFGISQLHQLRGRVGRGSAPGLCFLVVREPGSVSLERVRAVAATTDGFELARVDVELRREGDVLGAQQSGRGSSLRVLSLVKDEDIIVQARDDARAVLEIDPSLAHHPDLRAAMDAAIDESQASYLERS